MATLQQTTIDALSKVRTFDAEIVKRRFAQYTPEQMKQQYGKTGKTRQDVLDESTQRLSEIDAALSWVLSIDSATIPPTPTPKPTAAPTGPATIKDQPT